MGDVNKEKTHAHTHTHKHKHILLSFSHPLSLSHTHTHTHSLSPADHAISFKIKRNACGVTAKFGSDYRAQLRKKIDLK